MDSLHVHHIIALADGGEDILDNTETLCSACHHEWHDVEGAFEGGTEDGFDAFCWTPPSRWILMILSKYPNKTYTEIRRGFYQFKMMLARAFRQGGVPAMREARAQFAASGLPDLAATPRLVIDLAAVRAEMALRPQLDALQARLRRHG